MKRALLWAAALAALAAALPLLAQPVDPAVSVSVQTGPAGAPPAPLSVSLQILLLFTVLSVAPAILIMMTSFVRIVIVLGFLRTALTLQQPSNQIILALSLFLTLFVMTPTLEAIRRDALEPFRSGALPAEQALAKAGERMKEFMLKQTRESELRLLIKLARVEEEFASPQDLPLRVVAPAFMLSELKAGFQMGLLILLPFLVVDLAVSSVLMSLGMMMLPPTVVALPLKLMIFVLADGWVLIVRSLVRSFGP